MKKQIRQTPARWSQGFTIVETLIVLGVSGLMMISIMTLINGKQHIAQFQTSVNDLKSQMQQISNQVVNGEFPSQTFGCVKGSAATLGVSQVPKMTTDPSSSSSGDCVFVGKAVHFCQQPNCDEDDLYAVYSMVGLRNDTTDYTPLGISPFLAANTDNADYNAISGGVGNNITSTTNLEGGLSVEKIKYQSNLGAGTTGSFGFVQSLNGDLSNGELGGGQHSLLMVFRPYNVNSDITRTVDNEAGVIDASLVHSKALVDPSLVVSVCLKSGTTDKWVVMTLSSQSSQLDISTQIKSSDCSA